MNSLTGEPCMAYGYLRVLSDEDERAAYPLERDMQRYAVRHSLQLTAIYHEFDCGTLDAFNELVESLRLTGARLVLVPSLAHLGECGPLRAALLDRLEFGVEARVFALDELEAGHDAAA